MVEINNDTSMLVKANENDPIIKSSDLLLVPLDVKFSEASISDHDLDIGIEVKVYYDGIVKESYPAQINKVYLILSKQNVE